MALAGIIECGLILDAWGVGIEELAVSSIIWVVGFNFGPEFLGMIWVINVG